MITATVTAGDHVVDSYSLLQPIHGAWRATLRLAGEAETGEAIALNDGKNEWRGTIVDAINDGRFTIANVIGGANGLQLPTVRRFYAGGATVNAVMGDLCNDAGEAIEATDLAPFPQWRTRGNSLAAELAMIAHWTTGAYRITPGGLVSLSVASGETDPPGVLIGSQNGARVFETIALPPLAGLTIEGSRVGQALYSGGKGRAVVSCWAHEPRGESMRAATVGGKVLASSNGRVDVALDDGTQLKSLPLWSAGGLNPTLVRGARVLVLDLNDDPRATIAMVATADSEVSQIEIATEGTPFIATPLDLTGRPVRYGDIVMMPSGSAATPTPTTVQGPSAPMPASKVKL